MSHISSAKLNNKFQCFRIAVHLLLESILDNIDPTNPVLDMLPEKCSMYLFLMPQMNPSKHQNHEKIRMNAGHRAP